VLTIHNYTCALGFFLINITVQGLSVFMPTILKDLGWTDTKAQLYSVPPYVAACLVAIAIAYASDKTHQRGIWLAVFSCLAVTGFAVLRWVETPNIRYMALYFVTVGAFPGGPGFLAWAMNSKFQGDLSAWWWLLNQWLTFFLFSDSAGPAVRAVTSGYVVTIGTIGGIVAT
jgi:hypothetical protein